MSPLRSLLCVTVVAKSLALVGIEKKKNDHQVTKHVKATHVLLGRDLQGQTKTAMFHWITMFLGQESMVF